jgi:hypothetical protein
MPEEFELDKVYKTTLKREFTSTEKEWYEEQPSNEQPIHVSSIWLDDIPKNPPTVNTAVVEIIDNLILTEDLTVKGHRSWIACRSPGLLNTRLYDFIQPSKGHGIKYHVQVTDSNNRQVYIGEELEWNFDYNNGILTFKEDPTEKYLSPLKIKAYRYIGKKGSIDDLGSGGGSNPVSLDEAYNEGRVIEANEGPIVINPSNGSAALQITPVDYTPTNNVEAGQIINRQGIAYIYDESRQEWLSMFRQAIAFGAKRADGVMMNLSNFSSNMSGWPALRKGMILGVTAQASGGYSRKHIDLKIKGSDEILFGFNLFDHAYANGNLDLPFEENDVIQIKVSSEYEMTYNLVINVEIGWRL